MKKITVGIETPGEATLAARRATDGVNLVFKVLDEGGQVVAEGVFPLGDLAAVLQERYLLNPAWP